MDIKKMQRYERTRGKTSRFWSVLLAAEKLTLAWGRTGEQGESLVKVFANPDLASLERDKRVKQKIKEGYTLIEQECGEPASRLSAPAGAVNTASNIESNIDSIGAPLLPQGKSSSSRSFALAPSRNPGQISPLPEARPQRGEAGGFPGGLAPFINQALPTRMRPQGRIDGEEQWRTFLAQLNKLLNQPLDKTNELGQAIETKDSPLDAALKRLNRYASQWGEIQPESIDGAQALDLARHCLLIMSAEGNWPGMAPFMHWLVTKAQPETFLEVASITLRINPEQLVEHDKRAYAHVNRALRSALVKTSDDYYERVLALCQAACGKPGRPDFKWMVHFAFLLADDRPGVHALAPLAVIEAFEAHAAKEAIEAIRASKASASPTASTASKASKASRAHDASTSMLIPLVLEAPPLRVAALRERLKYEDCSILYAAQDKMQAVQTALWSALNCSQGAAPALQWVMREPVNQFVPLILALALVEKEAFSLLLPFLHDRRAQDQIDSQAAKHPAPFFRMMLQAVLDGSKAAYLTKRLENFIIKRDYGELAQWVEGDAKALEYIDRVSVTISKPLAAQRQVPPFLIDPPWLRPCAVTSALRVTLKPIATPFAFYPREDLPGNAWNTDAPFCPAIDLLIKAVLHYADDRGVHAFHPRMGPDWDSPEVCSFYEHLSLTVRVSRRYWEKFDIDLYGRRAKEGAIAILFANWFSFEGICPTLVPILAQGVMERFGKRAMPAIMQHFAKGSDIAYDLIDGIDCSDIAPLAARAMHLRLRGRVAAMAWLARFRRTAALRLIPDALCKAGAVGEAAANALVWIAAHTEGGRNEIERLAARYARRQPRIVKALRMLLWGESLERFPSVIPKMPDWFNALALRPVVLAAGGALPKKAMVNLVQIIMFSAPDAPYAGLEQVRQAATRASVVALSWDLFASWLANGAPDEDFWVMHQLGRLGDLESLQKLSRLIPMWYSNANNNRGDAALDALANMASESALACLNSFAINPKFKNVSEKARYRIAKLAQARGLSYEEMTDRYIPALNFYDRDGLELKLGEARLRLHFDELLTPIIKEGRGKRFSLFPKRKSSGEESLSLEAREKWSTFSEEIKELVRYLIARLEIMLVTQRRIGPETFMQSFASHRLMSRLAQRLVWGVFPDDDPRSAPSAAFRLCEDLSLACIKDEPFDLRGAAGALGRVGLVHPIELGPEGILAWGAILSEYELIQPIEQLMRQTYTFTPEEKDSSVSARFEGQSMDRADALKLASQGWFLNADSWGVSNALYRKMPLGPDLGCVRLDFANGGIALKKKGAPSIMLGKLDFYAFRGAGHGEPLKFGLLCPKQASEMLRQPSLLTAMPRD